MADLSQLQNLTLNPSEISFSFPPHRRRPLRSRTYDAFIGILSHCRSTCPQLQTQVDGGDFGSKPVSEENVSITFNDVNSIDASVPLPNSKGFEDWIVQETSYGENKENNGSHGGGFDAKLATVPESYKINLVTDGEQDLTASNGISVEDFLVVQKQAVECAIQNAKDQIDGFNTLEDIGVDKDLCIRDFSEVLDFGMDDMVVESSKARQDSQEKGTSLEDNIPKDAEHELQLKEMELEKLIYNSGGLDSSFCLNADEEIEEGEISGEAVVGHESFDALSEDAVSVRETIAEKAYAFEGYLDKEELFCKDEDRGCPRHEMADPSLVNVVNGDSNSVEVKSRKPAGRMDVCHSHSQNFFSDSHMETQRSGATAPCSENLTPSSRILQDDAAENQVTTEKDDNASKKKRKKGPLTEEKRAKKKKKDRLKRAEKNRKLGVKRLKLKPVLKPKKIVYCRHYLQGRCHEGEKCNFSHDTVPLTKSKPCGHFARHSCMKGDNCPFDHQLSNYPCKNYTSNGFCNRGSECLFSHEMPAKSLSITPNVSKSDLTSARHTVPDKEGSSSISKSSISKATKIELKSPSPLNDTNSSKHVDNHAIFHHKVDSKLCSAGSSPGRSAELVSATPVLRTAGQAPRGVSFLMNGAMSHGDTNKRKPGGSSTKATDGVGVGVGCKAILKSPGGSNKLNEISEKVAPSKPQGINFLSFGKPSSDSSTSKVLSNLLSSCNTEKGKLVIDDMGNDKLKSSLPESSGIPQVRRQMNPSATSVVSDLKEKVNGNPLMSVSQHVNCSSINRTRLDDPNSKETSNLNFSKVDTALAIVEGRQSTINLQETIKMPSLSFGGICDQSTGGLNATPLSSFKTSLLSNTPSLVQKSVQSTLAFAAKFEPDIKVGSSLHHLES